MTEKASALIIELIPAVTRDIRQDMRKIAQPELTILQLRVLSKVSHCRPTNNQLAAWAGISKATMSRVIATMVRKGLLGKETCIKDRRGSFIYLKPAGRKKYRAIEGRVRTIISGKLEKTGKRELKELMRGLAVLKAVFKK
jgi:DNA-binding MarR family transcriptional regulator